MNETYESAFAKLQDIIAELESEDITLEASLEKYEEGIKYYKYCMAKLHDYEDKVKVLMHEGESLQEKAYVRD
ncbi:exodeoxyribonuclease VII small subunit [Peptoniphilus equinus]|uniref:Exodeoxyribonuclease 7 small subunit n=1 Tax=Peptoniphilus equinus TaxID=3016343 RepID=A0ABY7QWX0_9FIRM|nr:exodeoxyribonuclease VII small subunit [Peptoniphilus equinus]WBW50594.1 exodeoxyribonuclease VII small subunit [Peptoniphilus equinus]